MKIVARLAIGVVAAGFAAAVGADETQLKLKDAPEVVLVRASCSGCHSVDYIQMNSPFMNRAGWDAEVKKMINAYGAVVPDPIAIRIATYLHSYYGNSPLPPRRRSGAPAAPSDGPAPPGVHVK